MTILIVPSWYPRKKRLDAGFGSFFREQAQLLAALGHTVIVLDLMFYPITPIDLHEYFGDDYFDGPLHVFSKVRPCVFPISNSYGKAIRQKAYRKMFQKVLEWYPKIDLLWAHSYDPAGYNTVLLAQEYGLPVIVTEHLSKLMNIKNITPRNALLLSYTIENSSLFCCVSSALKEQIIELTKTQKSLRVVPNLVNSMFFNVSLQNKSENTFKVLSVGVLTHRKRHNLLINSFVNAFYNDPTAQLTIIGDGPLYKQLQRTIHNLSCLCKIILMRGVSRQEVVHQMQLCDCFALASIQETFGVVYVEALACGKPIVTVHNGGADSIVTPEVGYIVEANNQGKLTEALLQMKINIKHFYPSILRAYCEQNWGKLAIESIYEDILGCIGTT